MQQRLRDRVRLQPARVPDQVAGLDCAYMDESIIAVAVVWDVSSRKMLETRAARAPLTFPYVPGLLSFREVPVLLTVLRRLKTPVQGILCDGQGIAHPRRLGLASHLGLISGLPTVGCAKSLLTGTCRQPAAARGSRRAWSFEGRNPTPILRALPNRRRRRHDAQACSPVPMACCMKRCLRKGA